MIAVLDRKRSCMEATQTLTILSDESLMSLGQSFFSAQRFGVDWECDASIDDLAATILHRRERLRSVIANVPQACFEPQRTKPHGQPLWTAGQCADHVVNSQYGVSEPAIIALMIPDELAMFEQPVSASDVPTPPWLDRAGALARLETATADYERLLDAIPRHLYHTATLKHRYFGTINLLGMLVMSAWHEQNHTTQIERLTG